VCLRTSFGESSEISGKWSEIFGKSRKGRVNYWTSDLEVKSRKFPGVNPFKEDNRESESYYVSGKSMHKNTSVYLRSGLQ